LSYSAEPIFVVGQLEARDVAGGIQRELPGESDEAKKVFTRDRCIGGTAKGGKRMAAFRVFIGVYCSNRICRCDASSTN
jgi:hypothetical protein